MSRNLLSAVMGVTALLMLVGCADMNNTPWLNNNNQGQQQPVQTTPVIAQPATRVIPQNTGSKVALLLPLTGKGAETGKAMMNASQLAMFDMNASSVFELMPEDTGKGATEAMSNAVAKGAKLVLGPLFSTDAKAITPMALQNGMSVVSFSTDATAAVGNTFLIGFMPQTQVNRVLSHASSVGLKRIALIAPRDTYGDSVATTYSIFMQRYALDGAGIIRYNAGSLPTATDLSVLKQGVDAVLIASPAIDSHKISNLLTENGYPVATLKRLGTGLWDQADATKLSGLQGAWYAASSPRLRSRFEHRYFQTYGTQPPRLASLAYDATALAVVMAKSGQGFGRQTLTNPNGFSGIDGIFRFNSEGLAERGLAVLEINQGAASVIADAPQRFSVSVN